MIRRRKRILEDLDRDIREHIELEVQDNIDRGMSPDDARYAALRKFGNMTWIREETRAVWTFVRLEQILQDFRLALRSLRKNPGFAFTAILILSLGIAGNVIVFGVMDALVLRTLNLPHPEQVMTLQPKDGVPFLSHPEVRDVRDGNTVFSAVACYRPSDFGVQARGVTRSVWSGEVSGQYFEVMGVKPYLGRLLERADDDHPGASDVAVLSWPEWKSNFCADPNVIGTTIRINKHPYNIVGVTPESFRGTERFGSVSIFVPMANEASLDGVDWLESRSFHGSFSIVRIKDGVSLPQAQAELNTIAARIAREHPKEEDGLALMLTRPGFLGDFIGGPVRAFMAGVMGLAGIVLLAACINLGGLFAARTADRTREFAIRMSIGSSRWRVVRQVLVEAVVIALCGGAFGCLLAWIALAGLANWQPPAQFPIRFPVAPQPSLILFTLAISMVAGFAFGGMPLRQIFKTDPNDAIKSGGVLSAGRRWAFRDVLLAAQIALCCVTVTAAFVSLRGLQKSVTADLGFNPQHALRTQFNLSEAGYTVDAATNQLQPQLLETVSQIPGVEAAGYSDTTPLNLSGSTISIFPQESTDFRPSQKAFSSYYYRVSPGYLAASETRLLAGRDVRFADTKQTPAVAIVNQEFARRLFHSEQAVGRYFKTRDGVPIQIVGVMADGKHVTISEAPTPALFFPISQKGVTNTVIIVRTHRDTAQMVQAIRGTIRDLDHSIPIQESGPWTNGQLALSLFPSQVAAVALSLFGAFGLLLSIAGTFGLASYTVSKRLRELSIRLALGARAQEILLVALGRMLVLLGTGSMLGITLGLAASRLLSAIVFQASAQDPFVLAAVAFTTVLTGLVSVTGPVRRALHLDPATLLREQ